MKTLWAFYNHAKHDEKYGQKANIFISEKFVNQNIKFFENTNNTISDNDNEQMDFYENDFSMLN